MTGIDSTERALVLLRDLIALPGPPGQEGAVRDYARKQAEGLGCACAVDAKGNLLAAPGGAIPEHPRVVVTAHLDEIALLVTGIEARDGSETGGTLLNVAALGGAHPWKWGEGPVEILARGEGAYLPGVLSFGSIHTASPASAAQQAREGRVLTWEQATVLTGIGPQALTNAGVRPGTRVALARDRRRVWEIGGGLIAAHFLDDRADLAAWLIALESLRKAGGYEDVLFAATVSEEVGGEGAAYLLHTLRPDICVALEIGPSTPDAPLPLDATPTVWVSDSFAVMDPRDLDLLADAAAQELGLAPHWQVVTRGGSDATCTASRGLCARPVTLAFAAENSHGFEIMHRDAPANLARLLVSYLRRCCAQG